MKFPVLAVNSSLIEQTKAIPVSQSASSTKGQKFGGAVNQNFTPEKALRLFIALGPLEMASSGNKQL